MEYFRYHFGRTSGSSFSKDGRSRMFYLKKEWLSPILFRLPIVITISLFVLFTVSCSKTSGKAVDNASPRPLSVRVLPVEQKQVRRNIESVGSLFPLDEVTVSSEVEGRVDQ